MTKQILLVEDNAGDILLMKQTLASEGIPIKVRVATDGQQAVEMLTAERFRPDLVILDLRLPKLSGLSFLEQTRPTIPVVVFSSSCLDENIRRSFELGARDFLAKPSDLKLFRREVSYIVQKWALNTRAADVIWPN